MAHALTYTGIHGSFNIILVVYTEYSTKKENGSKVIIRFPLPFIVGEASHPGNAEEKLRCEAAAYIWIAKHCPDIPIPGLRGFGFPKNRHAVSHCAAVELICQLTPWV